MLKKTNQTKETNNKTKMDFRRKFKDTSRNNGECELSFMIIFVCIISFALAQYLTTNNNAQLCCP